MKITLSEQCECLTGSLGSGFGYSIQRQRGGYCSKRNSKGIVPPDGHWRFVLACATLAHQRLHITDIQVHWEELYAALSEARLFIAALHVRSNYANKAKVTYNAVDIINLKTLFGL